MAVYLCSEKDLVVGMGRAVNAWPVCDQLVATRLSY